MPRARSSRLSGIFGRPSGKRSNVFCDVSSINCSFVKVNNCACASAGARSITAPVARVISRLFISVLAPQTVVGAVGVPLGRGLEIARFHEMLLDDRLVQGNAETGLVR